MGSVFSRTSVSTGRTDDFARHFHSLHYSVEGSGVVPLGRAFLYTLGTDTYNYVKGSGSGVGAKPLRLWVGDASGVSPPRCDVWLWGLCH